MNKAAGIALAQWIAATHPGLFKQLAAQTVRSNLGAWGSATFNVLQSSPLASRPDSYTDYHQSPAYQSASKAPPAGTYNYGTAYRAPARPTPPGIHYNVPTTNYRARIGALGDDGDVMDEVVVSASAIPQDQSSFSMPDLSSLADIPDVDISQMASTGSSSPGGLSSVGKALGSALSSVGGFLTSSQGLSTLANTATAYFKAETSQSQAQTAQAILQTQAQRASAGLTPASISYVNGVPVYTPTVTNGYATLPAGLGASVGSGYALTGTALTNLQPTFFQQYGTLLLIGGAVLAVGVILHNRN